MDVQFEEEEMYTARPTIPKKPSAMTRLIYMTGLAEDEKGAQRVLLYVALTLFGIAAITYFLSQIGRITAPHIQPNIANDSIYQQEVLNSYKK
jgi:hypothetical protein